MALSDLSGSGEVLTIEDIISSDFQRHPLKIETHTYNINTLEDLENLPEWVINSIGTQIYNFDSINENRIFESQLENYTNDIFGINLVDSNELSILRKEIIQSDEFMSIFQESSITDILDKLGGPDPSDKYLDSVGAFTSLNEEQRNYLFRVEEGEKYIEVKNRIQKISDVDDYRQKKDCDVWLIITSINNQPYGAVFAFRSTNNHDHNLMIQGISKFMIPGIFSLLQPNHDKILPRLNSILIPEVEKLAKFLQMDRIIVDPIGKQGYILEQFYGFHKIDAVDYPCEGIFRKMGLVQSKKHLAKDIK